MPAPTDHPVRAPLHIIEPTLTGTAGHCHSLVRALVDAATAAAQEAASPAAITVWAGRSALADWPGPARLVAHFSRRWRRLQAYFLLRRLLRQPGRVLISTARSTDLLLADWAASGQVPPHKLFLFVHWLSGKPARARRLSALARRQPHLEILAPTASVVAFFRACGFRATQVAYPLATSAPAPAAAPPAFKHLLVAGGARIDKGFDQLVDLVAELARRGLAWPVTVQTSIEPRHRHDPALASALARLRGLQLQHPGLVLIDQALSPADYRALFDGALVLQPYRVADFKDRVSGVTLDALAAGAPVVATDGTWMAGLLRRFGAGVATADLSPAGLISAIDRVLADHAGFAARARAAAAGVQAEHSARQLIDAVLR